MTFSHQEIPVPQEQDIAKIMNDSLYLLSSTLPKTISVKSEVDEMTGQVIVDAAQIETVILNLASNAADAITAPTGNIHLTLARQDLNDTAAKKIVGLNAGAYAVLALSDNGDGMSRNTLDHLFEPFFTTKDVGQGTGLGLAMVHGIITTHKGAISVSSVEGEGSTFTIYIPLV